MLLQVQETSAFEKKKSPTPFGAVFLKEQWRKKRFGDKVLPKAASKQPQVKLKIQR